MHFDIDSHARRLSSGALITLHVALLMMFLLVGTVPEKSTAAVVNLRPPGPVTLEYVVKVDFIDLDTVRPLLNQALSLLVSVPPEYLKVAQSPGDRFDFVIEVTNVERSALEMKNLLGPGDALTAISYTAYDSFTGRHVVRLLWDRIATMKNNLGVTVPHPLALPRLVSAMASEIYGRLPKLKRHQTPREAVARRAGLGMGAEIHRELSIASAETISRLIAHPKFAGLDAAEQRYFFKIKTQSETSAADWASVREIGVSDGAKGLPAGAANTGGPAKVIALPSRCERFFREEAASL